MVAVKEITWEEASAPGFETTTRQAWRAAVVEIAERAKATLPEANGRVDKAVAIVLAGDVEGSVSKVEMDCDCCHTGPRLCSLHQEGVVFQKWR